MKFTNFIKNNAKRISCCVLCFVLIFTLTLTAFAYDGEAPTYLTEAQVKDYIKEGVSLYNPQNLPVYSMINPDIVYSITKYSLINDMKFWDTEYFQVVTDDGTYLTSYFICPIDNGTGSNIIYDYIQCLPYLYYGILTKSGNNFVDNEGVLSCYSWKLSNSLQEAITTITTSDLSVYVYSVQRFKDSGLIFNLSEISHSMAYASAFDLLPTSNIVQISYASADSYSMDFSSVFSQTSVSNLNMNHLVSASTYSVTAYECFYAENASLISGTFTANFNKAASSKRIFLPDVVLKEEYQGQNIQFVVNETSNSYPHAYNDLSFYDTEKSFFLIPVVNSGTSTTAQSFFMFVFPEGLTPILYFSWRFGQYSTYAYYGQFQVLSNVDYDLYMCSSGSAAQVGSFDAETTTYTAIKSSSVLPTFCKSKDTVSPIAAGTSINGYPVIVHTMTNNSSDIRIWFNYWFGNKIVISMFPSTLNSVGFYTWSSADLNETIIKGTGSVVIPPSDFGDIDVHPGITDWEEFWSVTFDYDDFESDAFKGYVMSPYPEFEMPKVALDFLSLPTDALDYFAECLVWFAGETEGFLNYVGGPVAGVLKMSRMMFDGLPSFLKYIFIFSIFAFVFMKVMQYDLAYFALSGVPRIAHYEGVGINNRKRRGSYKDFIEGKGPVYAKPSTYIPEMALESNGINDGPDDI